MLLVVSLLLFHASVSPLAMRFSKAFCFCSLVSFSVFLWMRPHVFLMSRPLSGVDCGGSSWPFDLPGGIACADPPSWAVGIGFLPAWFAPGRGTSSTTTRTGHTHFLCQRLLPYRQIRFRGLLPLQERACQHSVGAHVISGFLRGAWGGGCLSRLFFSFSVGVLRPPRASWHFGNLAR